jgi:hypothetical protein
MSRQPTKAEKQSLAFDCQITERWIKLPCKAWMAYWCDPFPPLWPEPGASPDMNIYPTQVMFTLERCGRVVRIVSGQDVIAGPVAWRQGEWASMMRDLQRDLAAQVRR